MRAVKMAIAAGITFAAGAAAQPGQPAQRSGPATAAQPAAQASRFDPRSVVAEVRRVIAERYVLPERRAALDAVLADGLSSGRYIVTDPAAFAERVNADLERVGRDRHLNFNYRPQPTNAGEPRRQGPPSPEEAGRAAQARNHGVRELKVLPGNVRYLGYDGFDWSGDGGARALETAMRFLSGGDAVIIDLRRNGGGSPLAVQYLVSHFMDPNRPLMTFHMNGAATPDTTATLADVPAGRMVGRPLYVLTSGSTASAAEEFTGHVLGYRLGEVIGENTAGAGFRNQIVPIDGMFAFSVSVGRAVLAATGRDWEAVGHAPTTAAPVEDALEIAHSRALARLAETRTGPEQERLRAIGDAVLARVAPRSPGLALAAYAGRYGERLVTAQGDELFYQRGDGLRHRLIPLGSNRFAFEENPELQIRFGANGNAVTAFEVVSAGGPPQGRYERTQ
jgi:hypothetical protein